jgi:hypothetical protein
LTLRKVSGGEVLFRPPQPNVRHYTDLMNEYIDLNIVEKNLKEGLYYGTFSFISDVRKVFQKFARYMGED